MTHPINAAIIATMSYTVVMGEKGEISLPDQLLIDLGWTSETPLRWRIENDNLRLEAVPDFESADEA